MKKKGLIVVLGLLLIGLAGCSTSNNNESQEAADTALRQVSDKTLKLKIEDREFVIQLYDNDTAESLVKNVPQKLNFHRWGNGEYSAKLSGKIDLTDDKTIDYQVGEVALWPKKNYLCIYYGPTPVSQTNQPQMSSPGCPIGYLKDVDQPTIIKFFRDQVEHASGEVYE